MWSRVGVEHETTPRTVLLYYSTYCYVLCYYFVLCIVYRSTPSPGSGLYGQYSPDAVNSQSVALSTSLTMLWIILPKLLNKPTVPEDDCPKDADFRGGPDIPPQLACD